MSFKIRLYGLAFRSDCVRPSDPCVTDDVHARLVPVRLHPGVLQAGFHAVHFAALAVRDAENVLVLKQSEAVGNAPVAL
jgi:hypothetical protein